MESALTAKQSVTSNFTYEWVGMNPTRFWDLTQAMETHKIRVGINPISIGYMILHQRVGGNEPIPRLNPSDGNT